MDYRAFRRTSEEVAQDLLGRLLVRNTKLGTTAVKITETGAYEEGSATPTRAGMQYAPGTIFLMSHRGNHLLNVATDKAGYPSCVEIREVALHDKVISGSGKIARFLGIGPSLDGVLLGEELQILGNPVEESQIEKISGTSSNCIGYYRIKG